MTDFNTFWLTFPGDLCNRKGSKQEAEKKWNKIDKNLHEQIIVNMRELMRVDRKVKKTGAGRPEWVWPMAQTWLHQARWQDIDSIKQSHDMPIDKRKCSCGNDAAHLTQCWLCYEKENPDEWEQRRRDEFIKNRLRHKESASERVDRCRDFLRSKGYLGPIIPDRA